MKNNRLYMAKFISAPDEAYRLVPADECTEHEFWQSEEFVEVDGKEFCKIPVPWEPKGWKEYALDHWGPGIERSVGEDTVVLPYMPFFWPKTGQIFRSRSSAQRPVDIIRRWGGTAVVLECTPEWLPIEEANRRRKQKRTQAQINRLLAKITELEGDVA